jgi:hypothetical protein
LNCERLLTPGNFELADGENYREKALHCLMTADKARDPSVRLALLKLARNYVALADYLDAHGTAQGQDQEDKQKD